MRNSRKAINKIKLILLLFGFIFTNAAIAGATVYTFQPNPVDLYDLDHYYSITWGINWEPPSGEIITNAKLSITNIDNLDNLSTDPNILYMHLLDDATVGVTVGPPDGQDQVDAFSGQGKLLTTYTDPDPYGNPVYWEYLFTSDEVDALKDYAGNNGIFGMGFDPDCHYYNTGVSLDIETREEIPEPATLTLLGIGLLGAFFTRNKRRK